MLEVRDLHAFYGKSHVLHGVSLDVREGEIVSLLGRNGVGRSTTVKAIMGQVAAKGEVRFRGARVASGGDHRIAMALAVAGLVAEGETVVEDTECVRTSFPGFVETLNRLAGGPAVTVEA